MSFAGGRGAAYTVACGAHRNWAGAPRVLSPGSCSPAGARPGPDGAQAPRQSCWEAGAAALGRFAGEGGEDGAGAFPQVGPAPSGAPVRPVLPLQSRVEGTGKSQDDAGQVCFPTVLWNKTVEPNVRRKAFPFFRDCVIKASHAGDVASLSYAAKDAEPLRTLSCLLLAYNVWFLN